MHHADGRFIIFALQIGIEQAQFFNQEHALVHNGAAANGANANVTVGTITGKSSIDATAEATGKDSEAMAGGVMSATPKDQKGLNAKITVGVIDNSTINARAKAQNGGSAYAGGVISK